MATLAFVLAAFVDPVQAGLVLAIILVYRGPYPIVVAGVAAALLCETATVLAADDYAWGELIAPRAVSSLMQAAAFGLLVRFFRQLRNASEAAAAGPAPAAGNATASLTIGSLASARRPAAWQVRAYVKRRIEELRSR